MNNFKVTIGKHKNKNYINVYVNNSRRRFWNGRSIGVDIDSQENPELLKAAFELKLRDGWIPKIKKASKKISKPITKSKEINLFSLEAEMSKKTNSSAFKSLNILTALIGSPMYLNGLNF